jgi:hypothetical protein
MTYTRIKVGIVAPLLWMLLSALVEPQAPSKVIWLEEVEHDFGDVWREQPVRHAFTFRNVSGTPLYIDNVRTACGCTGTIWSREPIAPDSVSTILVEYDARQLGYFRKYARVYFRGQRKAEKLWVSGFVVQE